MSELRHYALSACLAQGVPVDPRGGASRAGAYLGFGTHPGENYQAVQDMEQRWLQRDYPSFHDATLDVVKCIDLSESREPDGWVAEHCRNPADASGDAQGSGSFSC